MARLFPVLLCLFLLAPAAPAQTTMEWIVLSVDWGGGVSSRGGMTARGIPSDSIVSPRDVASGLPTGKRQHKPLTRTHEPSGRPTGQRQKMAAPGDGGGLATGRRQFEPIIIRKRIDKSTPLIARAHKTRRSLPRVVLKGKSSSGEKYLQLELKNVRITSYSVSGDGAAAMEQVTLVYERIQLVR